MIARVMNRPSPVPFFRPLLTDQYVSNMCGESAAANPGRVSAQLNRRRCFTPLGAYR